MNKEAMESAYVHYKALREEVEQLVTTYVELYGSGSSRECIDSFEIEDDIIEVETSYPGCNRGCCGYESSWHIIPISYLWTDDWKKIEDDKREQEKMKKQQQADKKKKQEEEQLAAARLAQYQKLREEFEDVG